MSWSEKLKARWGINSNFQIILILIVFSINGSFAAWVAKPLTELVGISSSTMNPWIYYTIRVLIVFPIYQLTLPLVGFVFGQFKFFWEFEKKMVGRFSRKAKNKEDT
ncbi:MAG: prolipoprotein diacylglyceryl transferase [Cyclobacteriaceae bacterium]|nr:prolipoprotein diacylglyceryl transferase [Cyclobacteriaceae bacterium]